MNNQTRIGTVIEREVHIGSTSFLVQVMRFGGVSRYLVLNTDGQTVETEPFMLDIENMIKELNKNNFPTGY